jgi:hypothetical protein
MLMCYVYGVIPLNLGTSQKDKVVRKIQNESLQLDKNNKPYLILQNTECQQKPALKSNHRNLC